MADLDNDRTVVVERDVREVRDTSEASSPLGWIALLVALLLVIMFFLTDGFGLFGNNATNDTTEVQGPATTNILDDDDNDTAPLQDTQNGTQPGTENGSDTQTDPMTTPDPAPEPVQ